ncbi:related to phosphatidylserine decarboxylase [Rhynchosporium graminicola]|uniref:Phosphatidylserine decarboxylase proenzyme 2 n=1 Tax=Rhynchosporium graminicola TaxID=2792576 RepID=A0A1E1JQY9_9HELO|nr:related to phosphatidylserine decarboxylase [Rhynchosporium commune]
MVRISLPNRLKSYTHSNGNSRSSSPNPGASNMRKQRTGSEGDLLEGVKGNGLILKVVVVKARNLAAKDKNGTSDPYLVVTLGDSKNATQSVSKNLNPEWNVTLQMPVNSANALLLDCVCWDKDRFGKDYLGEFDLALEDIFTGDEVDIGPQWFPLSSKRPGGKKSSNVSGDVQLQFTLYDSSNLSAAPAQVLEKFRALAGVTDLPDTAGRLPMGASDIADEDSDFNDDEDPSDETDDPTKPENAEKKRRKLRLRGLRRKKQQHGYEFTSDSEVVGIVFLEIGKITDLPPERNMTRTSFDMDPFVVASLGKKTYRTRVIRHNLNPVYNEKMLFQVLKHEQTYSLSFTVIDRDKLSGNDFIAASVLPLKDITDTAPDANSETGLYSLKDPPDPSALPAQPNRSRFKLPISRSASSQSLKGMSRPTLPTRTSGQNVSLNSMSSGPTASIPAQVPTNKPAGLQPGDPAPVTNAVDNDEGFDSHGDPDLHHFTIPLKLKNAEKWEEKHSPQLFIKAKYVPYPALRQQFWRAMLRQYDTDESGCISKVELTTMLDTLGSTLKESTIDGWFRRFPHAATNDAEANAEMSFDEAVICLEDQLKQKSQAPQTIADRVKGMMPDASTVKSHLPAQLGGTASQTPASSSVSGTGYSTPSNAENNANSSSLSVEMQSVEDLATPGEEGEYLDRDDLNDKGEEHVVEIRECPICHQPRLNKRSDTDIITHIATCASQDWRQVNNIVMAGFVTASQAQRKWYSKVITKISYGGYKLGANSANILVQDRITGQINEERMSVYVRLGIRLLYKGLKSKDMEKKRIRKLLKGLSIKQGVKYDDPASRSEIQSFINFHQLDMSEVLLPMEKFKSFNEFFYRQLKPDARPCSAPDNPRIIVSPADCRSVVFNRMDEATKIWVKGREFSIERLLGNAYPQDAHRYKNGALGIFRLAPQDYHRFHIPVDGIMGEPKTIEGEYYTVNPMAIRSALDVYGENIRVVIPIDSVAHGRVMVICVGAMMVGSTVITRNEGDNVKRAEELGYFKFGGSTILVLFEEAAMQFDDDLVDNSQGALETLLRVGMSIGHHPTQSQHTPDMRKKDEDITDREKAEAKRRIEGSIVSENSSAEGSGKGKMTIASMAG